MISLSELKDVIEQQKIRLVRQQGHPRKMLADLQIRPDFALIVSGIRRCGKSTLLAQLLQQQTADEVLFLNFDTPRLFQFEFNDFQLLDEILKSRPQVSILFFDEIQIIHQWEIYIRGKLDEGYRVVVTGLNASLLSQELGTKLTGRHLSKELFPFSFVEFCEYLAEPQSSAGTFNYLKQGGFPQYLHYQDKEILVMLLNDILYRDIVVRYGVRDEQALKRLILFLAGNVGNLISAGKLKQSIAVKSTATVQEYLSHLEQAYLIQLVPKFAYSYKVQLANARKIYFIDNGLQEVISPSFSQDLGRKLENAVFWALRQCYQEIYYYNEHHKECDFVVCANHTPQQLIQVCWQLNAENRLREQNGLSDAMDYFDLDTGYIITFDQEDKIVMENKTIHVVPFHRFAAGI